MANQLPNLLPQIGEGYEIIIKCKEHDYDNVALPYTNDLAKEKRPGAQYVII